MCDHSELVAEMALLEKMSTQERLKLARKRRMQQLKKWTQREKDLSCKRKKNETNFARSKNKRKDYKVHFVPSVMLLEAAARNDVEEVRRLLMLGVSPDSTNEDGLTALHQCCIDDSEEMMKLLIDFGANVNAKDSEQWTPLHAAATCGHLHLVKYLISKEADLLAVNADGNMPYDICEDEATLDYIESEMAKKGITQEMIDETRAAVENEMLQDLKILEERGDDLEFRDAQGATPLHIAAANGYLSVVEFLLDHHVSTDVVDNDLWQPIHAAACWGHPDVVEMLVQAGADLNAKTKNGETPFDICEDPELKERIIQLKSEMETKKSTHSNRLRRSHSQNTRSQSVRRTSIREKSQISRREAREEARLRQEQSENNDDEDERKQLLDAKEFEKDEDLSVDSNHSSPVNVQKIDIIDSKKSSLVSETDLNLTCPDINPLQNSAGKDAVVIRNNGYSDKDNQINISGSVSDNSMHHSLSNRSSVHVPESVKVEIHVTVNTTPSFGTGTLADLKKQRADMRHRSSLSISPSDSPQSLNNSLKTVANNSHYVSATYNYESPPSPTISLKKFRGDPSDVVGDIKRKGCCCLM
ncbi:protein phosphatase 1 regulatory subunit 16A-like protein [Dinothrombium tinctorium]|uniref:Protein phosphatase 1 regulatory subunit 16A n=1 Tax=Dinothrombium tinctorium TaxID=1965070 RepID=A0A3S3PKZ4_9ACAR|nr:protein phosphatase 1 regulatory subunit 16A-like protein [Dinothrombium tinctorium]RWS03466.1 protein phosphatase 1 regulatory subunit 16A-like protein [Dinothrombium tinctorium]